MPKISEDYLIPIVIGVSGRKGAQPAEKSISSHLAPEMHKLRNTFPSSPFVVISSLAGSGDCQLVRLAVEQLRAKFISVLPFPPDKYLSTLPDERSRREFGETLGLAESSIDISLLIRTKLGGGGIGFNGRYGIDREVRSGLHRRA